MEKAVTRRMVGELVVEISNKAADSVDMNILVKEIISQGQMVRDIGEHRLREHRMEDE